MKSPINFSFLNSYDIRSMMPWMKLSFSGSLFAMYLNYQKKIPWISCQHGIFLFLQENKYLLWDT